MNTLFLLTCFGVGAVSALSGRVLAKWLILGFVVTFMLGAVLSPVLALPAMTQAVYGVAAAALGLILLLGYRPSKAVGLPLMLLLGLVSGLLGQQSYLFILGQLVWAVMALVTGFIVTDSLSERTETWAATAKRLVGVCVLVAVPSLVLSGFDKLQQASPDTAGAITYTGREQADDQQEILETLIRGVYFAFNADGESAVYDQLALAVDGPMLADLYLQQRRSHLLSEAEGAEVTVDSVTLLDAKPTDNTAGGRGVSFEANWQASGSVSHSAHEHERINRYEAIVSIAPVEGVWKIVALELLDEQRTVEEVDHAESGQ